LRGIHGKAEKLNRRAVFFFAMLLFTACGNVQKSSIILVKVDTMRSDHLGCYGYFRNTTPCSDSLAASGIRYVNVTAVEPWTLPSAATIFTGLLPLEHNARRRGDPYYGADAEANTQAEYLNSADYATAALSMLFS
jgi:arylsulfatase A-like enzyme